MRGGVMTALVVVASATGVRAASAQIPPIPVPTPPPQLQPVFELLAPTLYPQCGAAALVTIVAGQQVGAVSPQLGPDLFSAMAPVFVLCGHVPRPGTQLQCVLDLQQQAVVNAVLAQAGAPLNIGLHPEGDLIEQTIAFEDQLPPQVKALGAGKTVSSILGCAAITSTPPSQGDYSSMPGAYTPPPSSAYTLPSSAPVGSIRLPYTTAPPALSLPTLPPVVSAVTPAGEAVRYAIVWLLPLALLMFGGYFGGALTREVEPRALRP